MPPAMVSSALTEVVTAPETTAGDVATVLTVAVVEEQLAIDASVE